MLTILTNANLLWAALGLLLLGSLYLIWEGYKVHKLFADSIVGKLVKTLVVVCLIELYSLGVVTGAFLMFYPKGIGVILPIIFLWFVCLIIAIYSVHSAKRDAMGTVK